MSSNGLYRASERHSAYDAGTMAAVSVHINTSSAIPLSMSTHNFRDVLI